MPVRLRGRYVYNVRTKLELSRFSADYEKYLTERKCLVLEFVASDCTETFEHYVYMLATTTSAKSRILRIILVTGIEVVTEFNIVKIMRIAVGYGYRLHTALQDVFKKLFTEAHFSYVETEDNKKTLLVSVPKNNIYFALSRILLADSAVQFLSEKGVLSDVEQVLEFL